MIWMAGAAMSALAAPLSASGGEAPAKAPAAAFDAAAAFGAREDVRDVSISPDGKRIAILHRAGTRGRAVQVVPIDGNDIRTILTSGGDSDDVRSCRWSSATRLICTVMLRSAGTGQALLFTRMVAIDADGGHLQSLSARQTSGALGFTQNGGSVIDWLADDAGPAAGGDVLMTRVIIPEFSTGTNLAEGRKGLAVERVDTQSLKRTLVEQPRLFASEYITDGHGRVRVMGTRAANATGYDSDRVSYLYRKANGRDWLPLSTLTMAGQDYRGFNPYAVDPQLDLAYGFDRVDGRRALFSIALDGSMKRSLVYADPRVDVDELIQIGRQNRVVGASFATEKRQVVFFDPELKKLQASLAKAIPGLPLIAFVDASADEKRLVLIASSDVDPGRYYLYDKTNRSLGELVPVRPQLAGVKLAPVTPISYAAADGTQVPGYLTLPPGSNGKGLPAIVMPHGGPGARDEWGFDWLAQFFANRGYAVLQPNFRGSTGYGDAWFQTNGFQAWRTAVGDVNAGGRWLAAQGIAAPGKLAIVGWSYGGYAALQSAVLDPDLFKAIVAIAPVTDLETLRQESHDFTNYPQVDAFIGHGPHVRDGSPAQNVAAIKAPVLMFHGDRDMNVNVGESRMMASRLRGAGKKVEYVEYPRLDHQLADDAVRAEMLGKSDAFLRASLGL